MRPPGFPINNIDARSSTNISKSILFKSKKELLIFSVFSFMYSIFDPIDHLNVEHCPSCPKFINFLDP